MLSTQSSLLSVCEVDNETGFYSLKEFLLLRSAIYMTLIMEIYFLLFLLVSSKQLVSGKT